MLKKSTELFILTLITFIFMSLTVLHYYNPTVKYIASDQELIFTAYNGTTIEISGEVDSVNSIIYNDSFNFSNDPFRIVCNSESVVQSNIAKFGHCGYEGNFPKGRCTVISSGPVNFSLFPHYKSSDVRILYYHTLTGAITKGLPWLLVIFGIYFYLLAYICSSRSEPS